MFIQVGGGGKVRGIVWISNHSILWRDQNLTDLHILWVVVTYWVQMLVVVEKINTTHISQLSALPYSS